MALSNKRILEEIKRGNIIISPFNKQHLSTSSYDVTLGEYYFTEQEPPHYHPGIYNIWDKKHVDRIWGTRPKRAVRARELFREIKFEWNGIAPEDLVIMIAPGETILAHTNEFIGGKNTITTMMKARSSLGRNFIEVCKCAGWGDVGYVNRWTMEITNNSRHYTIPLVVGRRIAQIVFFETGPIMNAAADYTKSGKYQTVTDINELKKSWDPLSMVPKLYLDHEIRRKK